MSINMLDPVQEAVQLSYALAPRLSTMEGKVLGLYSNDKLNSVRLLEMISEELSWDYAFIVRHGRYNASNLMDHDDWGEVDACDAVILANADCGACSSSGIANAIALEKRGIPTLLITTTPFVDAVATMAMLNGMDGMNWAVVDHPIGSVEEGELRRRASDAARQFRDVVLEKSPVTRALRDGG